KRTLHGIAVGAARGGREQHAARQDYGFEGSHKWHGGRVRPRPFPQGTNGVTRRSSIQPISAPQPPPTAAISAAVNTTISVGVRSPGGIWLTKAATAMHMARHATRSKWAIQNEQPASSTGFGRSTPPDSTKGG